MSFLDKLTKAVSDTVDQGKKQVDQFMRIQKVKGEIGAEEQKIRDAGTRAEQVKQAIGDVVIARLKAGTLIDPELQAQADRVSAIDVEIAGCQAVIEQKKEEIVRIEAEGKATPVTPAPSVAPPAPATDDLPPLPGQPFSVPAAVPPPLPGAPPAAAGPVAPPPLPASATRACPQCGAQVPVNATFCTECGAKLG
jgi:hypothetical protein